MFSIGRVFPPIFSSLLVPVLICAMGGALMLSSTLVGMQGKIPIFYFTRFLLTLIEDSIWNK